MTFEDYLRQRGFDPSDARALRRRMFVECWWEPGFHRFWRLWNPYFGYYLHRLYVALGGHRRPAAASLLVFVLCGALHDVVALVAARQLVLVCTVAFGSYWVFALIGRQIEARQARWSHGLNALSNALFIVLGLVAGIVADRLRR